jgi:hypothetical protein
MVEECRRVKNAEEQRSKGAGGHGCGSAKEKKVKKVKKLFNCTEEQPSFKPHSAALS